LSILIIAIYAIIIFN